MIGFIISFSIALLIFIITSAIVLIRRRNSDNRHKGQVIRAPVVVTSATQIARNGYTVSQIPAGSTTTSYQTQSYLTPHPPQGVYAHMPAGQTLASNVHPYVVSNSTMTADSMNPPSYDVAVSNINAKEKHAIQNTNYQK